MIIQAELQDSRDFSNGNEVAFFCFEFDEPKHKLERKLKIILGPSSTNQNLKLLYFCYGFVELGHGNLRYNLVIKSECCWII